MISGFIRKIMPDRLELSKALAVVISGILVFMKGFSKLLF